MLTISDKSIIYVFKTTVTYFQFEVNWFYILTRHDTF